MFGSDYFIGIGTEVFSMYSMCSMSNPPFEIVRITKEETMVGPMILCVCVCE